ncbi:MAG TPA: hypothetical protein VIF82_17355 [Burkholderiaceae bacterium]|jgi:hypothetical protein
MINKLADVRNCCECKWRVNQNVIVADVTQNSVTDRHQIYCGNVGCQRKIVGGKFPDVKEQWANLMSKPHADDMSREQVDGRWFGEQ